MSYFYQSLSHPDCALHTTALLLPACSNPPYQCCILVSLYPIDLSVRDHLRKLVSHQLAHHYCSSTFTTVNYFCAIYPSQKYIYLQSIVVSFYIYGWQKLACLLIIISLPRLIFHLISHQK